MPELPEVEVTRKRCQAILVGQSLTKVQVYSDPIVFCEMPAATLQNHLQGRRVTQCLRKGKYFWWAFDQGDALLLHLGMTGVVHVPELPDLALSHGIDVHQANWPPRFVKLDIELANGQRLAFCDPRRFGRIRWQNDPLNQAPLCELGVDPISEPFLWDPFYAKLKRRKGSVKGLLLNQAFVAGIGNWIADEVLYQAAIAPHHLVHELNQAQAKQLFVAIRDIVERAVKVDANAERFPEHWLFHKRWRPTPGLLDQHGHPIVFSKVAGRSTAWVPKVQTSEHQLASP